MAAKVDFTKCSICQENFSNPKKLPCLHTFCESCIESHFLSKAVGNEMGTFTCPVCGTTVSLQDKCSPQQWLQDLPIDNLVVGLIEQRKIQHEEKQCMSCERLGNTSIASFICVECCDVLCEGCQQCHKANKFTSKHKIVSVRNISKVEKSLDLFRNECTEHKEDVKLYCIDHDVPCCSLCASVKHRKCQEVVTISQAAKGFIHSGIPNQLQQNLGEIEEDAEIVSDHNKKCKEELNAKYDKALKKVDNYFDTLKTKIDSIKDTRKNELEKMLYKNQDETEKNVQILENLKKKTRNEREILDISLSKSTDFQAMIETKRVQGKQENHTKTLIQTVQNTFDYEIDFTPSISMEEFIKLLDDKCIKAITKTAASLKLKSVPSMKLQLKSRIDTESRIVHCFCTEDGTLCTLQNSAGQDIVSFFDLNGTYKTSFYPQNTLYNREKRTNTCKDKTSISGNKTTTVYISDSGSLIQFMRPTGQSNSNINVNCSGFTDIIYSNRGLVAVLFQNRIDILGKDGAVTTSFQAVNPQHPCMNIHSHLLYVEKGVIRCKNMDAKNVDILAPELVNIGGMAVDGKGNIFVSLPTRNIVSRIAGKTGLMTDVLGPTDGLVNPSKLCVSENGKILYVVNGRYGQQTVLIFQEI